jgi:hypothetical protein
MQWQSDSFPPARLPPESIATIRANEAAVLLSPADSFGKNLVPATQSNFCVLSCRHWMPASESTGSMNQEIS